MQHPRNSGSQLAASTSQHPGLVSIIIPLWNRADIVIDTLESARRQTHRPIELVIVDNGSTDSSLLVAQDWAQAHSSDDFIVKVVSQPVRGCGSARNMGLQLCKGDFIQFLDSDDLYHPDKTAALLAFLQAQGADVAVGACRGFRNREEGNQLASAPAEDVDTSDMRGNAYYVEDRWSSNGPLFRRELIARTGLFDTECLYSEDRDYFLRVKLTGARIALLGKRLSFFRRASANNTAHIAGKNYLRSHMRYAAKARRILRERKLASQSELDALRDMAFKAIRRSARTFDLHLLLKAGVFWLSCRLMKPQTPPR